MSIDTSFLDNYRYFRQFPLITRATIEELLIPGLTKQGRYSEASSGIELPHSDSDPAEYLPLDQAATLITAWLEEEHNLESSELEKVKNFIEKAKKHTFTYHDLTLLLNNLYQEKSKSGELNFTTAVQKNLEGYKQYQDAQPQPNPDSSYNPGSIIDTYNQTYQEIYDLVLQGYSPSIAARLIPDNTSASKQAFATLIAANLDRLASAQSLSGNPTRQAELTTKELTKIIKEKSPEYANILNYAGDGDFQEALTSLVNQTQYRYTGTKDNAALREYIQQKRAAESALPHYLPSVSDTERILANNLVKNNISQEEATLLSVGLIKELTRSSSSQPSTPQLVDNTLSSLNLDHSHRQLIINLLNKPTLSTALSYHASAINTQLSSTTLNTFDRRLLRRGFNPLQTLKSPKELRQYAQKLLPNQSLPDNNQQLLALIETEYTRELSSSTPNQTLLNDYYSWLNYGYTTFSLDKKSQKNARRSKAFNSTTDLTSRARHAHHQLLDKLYKIDEKLPWNVALKKGLSLYDQLAEKAVLILPLTKGKVKIPLLRFTPWALENWQKYKLKTATKWLGKLENSQNIFGKFTRYNLHHYLNGGGTFTGLIRSSSYSFYSTRIAKPLTTWASKKFTTGVFKYASKSVGRTGRRLILKTLGKTAGKTLLRFGTKAAAALASAGTVIGTTFFAVGLVIDLGKLAVGFVKKFFKNIDFRRRVLGITAAVTGALAAFQLAPIGIFLAAIGALALQQLLLASGVALGLLVFFMLFFNIYTKMPWSIDSAPAQLFTSIFCKDGENDGSAASAAACIADILSSVGLNPLLASGVESPLWQQVLSALLPNTTEAIEKSAVGQGAFQCVGLVAAGIAESGGAYWAPPNANMLNDYPPPGYTYVAGAGSCRPGDAFVDLDGEYGHTGWITEDAGAQIVCVDANYGAAGLVRGPDSCRYSKSNIDGCLKKL